MAKVTVDIPDNVISDETKTEIKKLKAKIAHLERANKQLKLKADEAEVYLKRWNNARRDLADFFDLYEEYGM